LSEYDDVGIRVPRLELPRPGLDFTRWAVIACDQFTSQPEYWREVEDFVGDAPSTLQLIFPEVYLERPGRDERITRIQDTMRRYLDDGTLRPRQGMVYVERRVAGRLRRGVVLALDLEQYDFTRGARSLIRATEGTIVERLPPRIRVREGAPLELPHILVLIDDPGATVVEPLSAARPALETLYDFDLMFDSGHLAGYALDRSLQDQVVTALRRLAEPANFAARYGVGADEPVMLFAVGDGNHSLATAKATWDRLKPRVGMEHPARWALVEIENVHDQGLEFEPIHRVLFGVNQDLRQALRSAFGDDLRHVEVPDAAAMCRAVDRAPSGVQTIGLVERGTFGVIELARASANLPVGSLQPFLDTFVGRGGAQHLDYVHGDDVLARLGGQPENAGFRLPAMHKSDLFKTVVLDGALPRKTFSMGEAREKRFYLEARRIT